MAIRYRPLSIDDEARAKVALVRNFAERKTSWYYPGKSEVIPGYNYRHVCHLDTYRCVFSITVDPGDNRRYRHLSISVPSSGFPHPAAAFTIAELFGFTGWDGNSFDSVPKDWMARVDKQDHCVILGQLVE